MYLFIMSVFILTFFIYFIFRLILNFKKFKKIKKRERVTCVVVQLVFVFLKIANFLNSRDDDQLYIVNHDRLFLLSLKKSLKFHFCYVCRSKCD